MGKFKSDFITLFTKTSFADNMLLKTCLLKFLKFLKCVILIDYKSPDKALLEILDDVARGLMLAFKDFNSYIGKYVLLIDSIAIFNYQRIINLKAYLDEYFELLVASFFCLLKIYKYHNNIALELENKEIKHQLLAYLKNLEVLINDTPLKSPQLNPVMTKLADFVDLKPKIGLFKLNSVSYDRSMTRYTTNINFFNNKTTVVKINHKGIKQHGFLENLIQNFKISPQFKAIKKHEYFAFIKLILEIDHSESGENDSRFKTF